MPVNDEGIKLNIAVLPVTITLPGSWKVIACTSGTFDPNLPELQGLVWMLDGIVLIPVL